MTPTDFRALVARVEAGYHPCLLDYRECDEAQNLVLVAVEDRRLKRAQAALSQQVMLECMPAAAASGAGLYARRAKGKHA